MVISTGYLLNTPDKELDHIITLIAFNIMIGTSIYYMYNYYYYFLTIFNWRYCWGLFLAAPAIMFPFFNGNYWAVSLGIEIIIVGIIMGLISFRVRQTEKEFSRARFIIFGLIGCIVTFLGCFYKDFSHGNLKLKCALFVLYGCYILTTVAVHINRSYILEITGRVLYGGKRMKMK